MANDIENKINQTLGKFLMSDDSDKSAIKFAKYLIAAISATGVEPQSENSNNKELPIELPIIERIALILEDRKDKGAKLKQLVRLLGFSSRSSSRMVSNALARRSDDLNIVQIPEKQGGTYYLNAYAPIGRAKAKPSEAKPSEAKPSEAKQSRKSKRKIEGTSASNETMRFILERPILPTAEIEIANRLEKIGYNPKSAQYVVINLSDPDKQGLINWNRSQATVTLTEKGKAYNPGPMPFEVKQKLGM